MDILNAIQNVSGNLTWGDIETFCSARDYMIIRGRKNSYKVSIGSSVWTVHLCHGTAKLKKGIVSRFKKVLQKEKVL